MVAAALVVAETHGGHGGIGPVRELVLAGAATVTLAAVFRAIISSVRRYAYLDGVRDTVKAQRQREQQDDKEQEAASVVRFPRTGSHH
ncbi:hypothetical protein GCM10010411_63140 [Actinomadura fulvescens]|uniref:Uncharacterized protein n=1 Tax=Actinomadura fulvescens TaxID=46160 RepID=A0ABN3Q752_9ACTN